MDCSGFPVCLIGRVSQAVYLSFYLHLSLFHSKAADMEIFSLDSQKTHVRIHHHLVFVKGYHFPHPVRLAALRFSSLQAWARIPDLFFHKKTSPPKLMV